MTMDLNCDLGELPELIASGAQEALMASMTSVNIACGGHAGDEQSMEATVLQAQRRGVAIGAHPSYPGRAGFGRVELNLPPFQIAQAVCAQCQALAAVAGKFGARIGHVKAHGALYNRAARDAAAARAFAEGVARWNSAVVLVGLAGSVMLRVFREAGFKAAAEAFADRRYEVDGTLSARSLPDAVIHEPEAAAAQALQIALEHSVIARGGTQVSIDAQTICIHSDTPGAVEIAAAVAEALRGAGIKMQALSA